MKMWPLMLKVLHRVIEFTNDNKCKGTNELKLGVLKGCKALKSLV